MAPASALHRHQSSLENIIDSSAQPPLGPSLRLSTSHRFYQIVNHFDVSGSGSIGEYDRVKLVRLTYEYVRSEESKGNFLRAFFQSAALPMDGDEAINLGDADLEAELRTTLFNFAEYLLDSFFLPCMALWSCIPLFAVDL